MKISEKEQKILAALQLRADLEIGSLRKLTGMRDSTIHYCLNALIERQVIRRYVAIDTARLGYMEVALCCSIGIDSQVGEMAWIRKVCGLREVISVWQTGGTHRYFLLVLVRSLEELEGLYERIFSEPGTLQGKVVAFRTRFRFYGRRYLGTGPLDFIERGHTAERVAVDDIDERILSLLGQGGGLSKTIMAQKLALPLATLSYRIRRLTATKVIVGELYSDAGEFSMLIYSIYLSTRSLTRSFEEALHQFALDQRIVTALGRWVGPWDYKMMVDVKDLKMLGDFISQLRAAFPNQIVALEEVPILMKYKNDTYLS